VHETHSSGCQPGGQSRVAQRPDLSICIFKRMNKSSRYFMGGGKFAMGEGWNSRGVVQFGRARSAFNGTEVPRCDESIVQVQCWGAGHVPIPREGSCKVLENGN
jgi:hypothetical protein